MNETMLWDAITLALLCTPTACPRGDYPPEALASVQRLSTYSGAWRVDAASWQGWDYPRSVDWLRDKFWLAVQDPSCDELDSLPPLWLIHQWQRENDRFQRRCEFWRYVRPDCRDTIGRAAHENAVLTEALGVLRNAVESRDRNDPAEARRLLGEFRLRFPEYYHCLGSMPCCPYWYD